MAIQFNPNALNKFSGVNFGDDNAIANLGGENNLVQKDKLGSFLLKPFRSGETEKRNNAVRTELLKALGQAFNLNGVTERDGKTTFSEEFMDRLSELLGPAFKRDDFKIKNGAVASGKPLTQRRIKAIFKAAASVNAETPYDAQTYRAKADSIEDVLNTKDPNAPATIAGLNYVKSIKKTIAFLESDLAGLDAMCRNPNDLEPVKDFIITKTHLCIYPEEIDGALGPLANPNDPDGWPERRAQIKTYLKQRMEGLVKSTVDICLEAMEAGAFDDCMAHLVDNDIIMKDIQHALEQFKWGRLGGEVQAQYHAGGVDNDAGGLVVAPDYSGQDVLDAGIDG